MQANKTEMPIPKAQSTKTMEEKKRTNKNRVRQISEWLLLTILAVVVLVIILAAIAVYKVTQTSVGVDVDNKIELTPTQITSMEAIGEWEFLSISDEEMVDTVRRGFFSDDELVRIYYGTLRLGIDMHKLEPGWIEQKGDSIIVKLPPIGLLDTDFIDEARTQSFFQSGSWSEKDLATLYKRAYYNMKKLCMTPENLRSAEDNAVTQFHQLLRTMGFKNVIVRIGNTPEKNGTSLKTSR